MRFKCYAAVIGVAGATIALSASPAHAATQRPADVAPAAATSECQELANDIAYYQEEIAIDEAEAIFTFGVSLTYIPIWEEDINVAQALERDLGC
jgi:hypothetical protein